MRKAFILLFSILFINFSNAENINNSPVNDTLKIVSWNVHLLPYFFVFPKSKKRKRTKLIADQFNYKKDYDIIVLQEVFSRSNRRLLKRRLKNKYPYIYGPPNKKRHKIQTNSGLMVFSERPLIYKKSIEFDVATSWDNKMARKGAMLLEGEFNGNLFQIINTHTQGKPAIINGHQFHMIYDGLIEPFERKNIPQIICGDLNCNSDHKGDYTQMQKILDVDPAPMHDDRLSKNGDILNKTIDYILVRDNDSNMKIIRTSKILIGPDWEKSSNTHKRFGKTVGLSDHYPMEIMVTW